jgi:integrase
VWGFLGFCSWYWVMLEIMIILVYSCSLRIGEVVSLNFGF